MDDRTAFQMVDDLRDFANFVEEHGPDLPDVTVELRSWVWGYDADDSVPLSVALAMRAGVKTADKVTKEYTDDYFRMFLKFGKLEYRVICNRDEVCEKNVIGTKTVTKKIPPKGNWTEEEVEEDIVEWVCNPLLAIASDRSE
tara:strand:+ start:184 stop:609 length:426 start_codon:yes stop_codon:yes gene_type:complete